MAEHLPQHPHRVDVDMAERLGLDVHVCDVEWGKGVPVEEYARVLEADKEHKIKGVFVTQNETATGVTSDVAGVRAALNAAGHPAMLYVDGVSSILVTSNDLAAAWALEQLDSQMEQAVIDDPGEALPAGTRLLLLSGQAGG